MFVFNQHVFFFFLSFFQTRPEFCVLRANCKWAGMKILSWQLIASLFYHAGLSSCLASEGHCSVQYQSHASTRTSNTLIGLPLKDRPKGVETMNELHSGRREIVRCTQDIFFIICLYIVIIGNEQLAAQN